MRLDQRMLEEGLVPSRAKAQALIAAGAVTVDGRVATRAATRRSGPIVITEDPCPWVSRAALKLVGALDHLGWTPVGAALDIGASTGGFTEVLLARGAASVDAVDVGHGQLHSALAEDPRVRDLSGTNARTLTGGGPYDWIVADVSFIGLTKALGPALGLAAPGARLIALIKPQFEAGPSDVGKGGIVKDRAVHARVCADVRAFLEAGGWSVAALIPSPILGSDGNTEFLIAAERTA